MYGHCQRENDNREEENALNHITPRFSCSGPTAEFTRRAVAATFESIKLHDKHAIAARVQRFVGPSLAIVQTARQQFPTTCETEAFGRSEGQTLARRQEQSHP